MNRIRVGHICEPGLWKRAPLITPTGGHKATARHDDPRFAWAELPDYTAEWVPTDDCYVCLDDRLGLGLAGLAATITLRLGWPLPWHEGLTTLAGDLVEQEWFPGDTREVHPIPMASTYLRLTDDLCKAVGLEREGHEVAGWEYTVEEGWLLSTSTSPPMPVTAGNHTDNWQAALEAALAEVS